MQQITGLFKEKKKSWYEYSTILATLGMECQNLGSGLILLWMGDDFRHFWFLKTRSVIENFDLEIFY